MIDGIFSTKVYNENMFKYKDSGWYFYFRNAGRDNLSYTHNRILSRTTWSWGKDDTKHCKGLILPIEFLT